MSSYTCALFNKAFVGMQPQFKQMPPRLSFSMIAVLNPNCEALIAATYPPGPLPITTTSYAIIFKLKNEKVGANLLLTPQSTKIDTRRNKEPRYPPERTIDCEVS